MIETSYFTSPIGFIEIQVMKSEILSVKFTDEPKQNSSPASETMLNCLLQMQEYFDGKRTEFDLPVHIEGSNFQKSVWNSLCKIPYGKTISYKQLAQQVHNEKASRAVGNANGQNSICIIIPCHRVILSNGKIGGYAYGTEIKKALLLMEQNFYALRHQTDANQLKR